MIMKNVRLACVAGLAAMLMSGVAHAEDFHGFDPANFDGVQLSAEQLAAMVTEAVAAQAPRNGQKLTIGFANLSRDISFCLKVEEGILANAAAAGIDVQVVDNRLDGATALANAQSFLQRNVDFVIEFQTDAQFGATIMQQLGDADTKVIAIDIPMPGATFFGANNPKVGFIGGAYLGEAALAKFGAEQVAKGYLVVGELPQSGAVPAMRTGGQIAGFKAEVADFPDAQIIKIDTKNTLEESFIQTNNIIGRIPAGVPIMVTAINDQATTGILRAVKQAGREADLIVVGMGADEVQTMVDEPAFVASVGQFPERYGNFLVPMALMELAGKEVPSPVLMTHEIVTDGTVCNYYADFACATTPDPVADFVFPEEAYQAHLAEIRTLPEMQDSLNLIPTN